ncbi:right-handed parallel beta-helix repeat-containing protein [Candidatus Nomurabacteria bacterium]|nr:right-handed parallel beta-helix repeat-containing protein [Candidatus Nomurabacteria bacterium]
MTFTKLMFNKQVLLALGMIVFIGAVVAAGTGAFFSSQATATGNVFAAGTLDLMITRENDGPNPADTKDAEWVFNNMAPGGTPVEESMWLRNVGSIEGASVAFGADFSGQGAIAKQMRITTLEWAGTDLLSGAGNGAGANLSGYAAPTNCDIEVRFGNNDYDTISEAVDNAVANDVICVAPGNYTDAWENNNGTGFPIDIDVDGVQLVSTDGANTTNVGGGIRLTANNVAVKGFTINGSYVEGTHSTGIYVQGSDGADIAYNEFDGTTATAGTSYSIGIYTASNSVSNMTVANNEFHNWGKGLYLNPSVNTVVEYNSFMTVGNGMSNDNPTNNVVRYNTFEDHTGAAVAAFVAPADSLTVEYNHLADDSQGAGVSQYGTGTIDAENNWWGDNDPSDQVNENSGTVDYTPFLAGPVVGSSLDANGNGYFDMHDFRAADITNVLPGLDPYVSTSDDKEFKMAVQLDGSTDNSFNAPGTALSGVTIEFTLNQN